MTIGVTEDHTALADMVRRWAADHAPPAVARTAAEDGGKEPAELWQGLAGQGLLGMHLAEDVGGAGGTLVETAIAAAELGGVLSGAMYVPTVTVSTILQLAGGTTTRYLAGLADGSTTAALAVTSAGVVATTD